ncbi:nucleoid-associated protein [Acetivibrio mesophilus]|uniref:Nucleoid-associated protein n=1 Tax=Acetivibrio mesophilus TaxID=2487273 RepID=A0A4Q0I5G6_9FIRM|nr:nucleoid-associated protein [Acetivibrio mesophilus]ODM25841.1 nucleoid-associated protein [Clostridium sp. Bc-iso-3]RXE59573.1 nucleoid-associated protein [Acetivibrio mesophilus]HHV30535.1 nucleoid-associated protein [Clostridium sp.]
MPINIKRAIIHVLDKEANEPMLNEFELGIDDDIHYFLEKHITRSLGDDESRKAVFKNGRNIIKEVCQKIFIDNDYFIEGSKEIARQLFKAMKTNSSISSTDLIICIYEENDEESVAILKMDYTVSFIHEVELVDNKFKISIKKQDISLPGVNQRIQKCAFIRAEQEVGDYDLIILDNQISKKNQEEPIAQFFLQTFLGADLLLDSKTCTRIFKKETENWIRNKAKEGETSIEVVREFVNEAIRKEDEIDLDSFSSKVFSNKVDLRDEYISTMKEKGLTSDKFEVDREWVERKLSKIRLKTESDIELVIDYEQYNDREKFEIVKNPDGTRNIIIKNIISIVEK